jgi:hypothetical protein
MTEPVRPDIASIGELARLVGLPLDPEHVPGVAEQLTRVLAAAALVVDFPLPDEIDAAPVFRP